MDKVQYYLKLKRLSELKKEEENKNKIDQAKNDFFSYCSLMIPEVYKPEREYLVELCEEFQSFLESDDDLLLLNLPPRHCKSLTAGRCVEWSLGRNPRLRVATCSYNEDMATDFSKEVRDTITETKVDDNIVYSDIFPNVKIKRGSSAAKRWALRGTKLSYLATSPGGSATGKGFDLLFVDDVIKGIADATNELALEKQWDWFTKQMISRVEKGGKIVVIMTRWHSKDLAGRIESEMPSMGYKIRVIKKKALVDEETHEMFCSDILSYEDFKKKQAAIGLSIANANYQQEPIDQKGRLYQKFQTYDSQSEYIKRWIYTDTADKGQDFLCSIAFGETRDHKAEILDVIYTKKPMEETEIAHANQVITNRINHVRVESNSGGRGFSRNSERIAQEKGYRGAYYDPFHQSDNKQSRILSNSALVENLIYFPDDWALRWPEFHEAITAFQREGKNTHDDAPDALTGVIETINKEDEFNFIEY